MIVSIYTQKYIILFKFDLAVFWCMILRNYVFQVWTLFITQFSVLNTTNELSLQFRAEIKTVWAFILTLHILHVKHSIMYYSRSIMRYTSIQLCKYTYSSKITFRGRSKNSLGFYSNIAYFATNVGIKKSLLSLFSVGLVLLYLVHKS